MNNNKKTKRCIDCGNELFPKSYGSEDVVCEECLLRIKRQFWSTVNIEMTD